MSFQTNYLRNLAWLAMRREPDRPLLFSYYVTHRCLLNCRYCSDGEGIPFKANETAELDIDAAKRLITILARSTDTLDLTGGEPMMRPDLEELIDHARSHRMRTVINTKGINLENRPGLMRADVLVLSVDSMRPEKIAALHGSDTQTAAQILSAVQYASFMHKRTNTQLVLSAVATPENLDDAAEVLEFAARNHLGFHLSPQLQGVCVHPDLIENEAYARLIDRVIEAKRAGGGVLGIAQYLQGIRDFQPFRCHPLLMPVIRPNGKLVYPCLELPLEQVDVLEAGGYEKALRIARERRGPLPECLNGCNIFCHMALSLLQRHPIAALREGRHWSAIQSGARA